MSVLHSADERTEAAARLEEASDETLARDLADWSVATLVSSDRYDALATELHKVRELHAEEEVWIGLIAAEIRRRRTATRAPIA